MKKLKLIFTLIFFTSSCYAQQYGWRVLATPRPGYQMKAVEFKDSLHGWCDAGGLMFRTTDGGHTWDTCGQPYLTNGVLDISFSDTLYGWAVATVFGDEALIWRTTDGGITWSEKLHNNGRRYNGTAARGATGNITVGSTFGISVPAIGKVAETTNGGQLWIEKIYADSVTILSGIQFVDSTHGWMIGGYRKTADQSDHSGFLRTLDGGSSWQLITQPVGPFSFVDSVNGIGYGGRNYESQNNGFYVVRTRNGGLNWDSTFILDSNVQGDGVSLSAVSFVDTLNGWIFGDTFYQGDSREIIIRTTDGGTTWTRESVGLAGIISDALMIDKHHGWTVTLDGKVLGYELITSVSEHLPELPTGFALKQNYPNPFNNSTAIEYEIPQESDIRIAIYDGIGKLITTLVDQIQPAGVYRVQFDAKSLSSNIYYYTMTAGLYRNTKQLILLK